MNCLHKFAALTLSAVLSVCLLAGCGASASSTASSTASSVASSVAASEAASSAASKAQVTVEFTVTAADGSVSSVLLNVTDGEKLSTALAEAASPSDDVSKLGVEVLALREWIEEEAQRKRILFLNIGVLSSYFF